MKLIAVLLLLLQSSADSSMGAEQCPLLPADSGMTWSYQQGPDFGVCYATDGATGKDAFGVYLGYAPQFDPQEAKATAKGRVGGHKVTWYERSSFYIHSDPMEFSQETLIKLGRDKGFAHVWVMATSAAQMTERLAVLKGVSFR